MVTSSNPYGLRFDAAFRGLMDGLFRQNGVAAPRQLQ